MADISTHYASDVPKGTRLVDGPNAGKIIHAVYIDLNNHQAVYLLDPKTLLVARYRLDEQVRVDNDTPERADRLASANRLRS